jgi:hypothetical protein
MVILRCKCVVAGTQAVPWAWWLTIAWRSRARRRHVRCTPTLLRSGDAPWQWARMALATAHAAPDEAGTRPRPISAA